MSELTGLTPLYVSPQLNFIPSLEALDLKVAAERASKRGLSRFSRPLIHFRFYRISNLNHLLPPLLPRLLSTSHRLPSYSSPYHPLFPCRPISSTSPSSCHLL